MQDPSGYRGKALEFLRRAKARVGDILEVQTEWGTVTGTLVPRYVYGKGDKVVLKLPSGYNIGLKVSKLKGAKVAAKGEKPSFSTPPPAKHDKGLPKVLVLGTGGTIASRVDYRTGAVKPAVSSGELDALVPELSKAARVEPEVLFEILSENMGPAHWSKLAARVGRAVKAGSAGVVITHGTDTMGYTAAALSFALRGVPIPVILVGAQRSPDRPSSDAVLNLIGAVSVAATAPFSGVYVAMHFDESDERIGLHRGTRVRKNHTSRRDAFESIGVPMAAVWSRSGFEFTDSSLPPRGRRGGFRARPNFDKRVSLLKFYPSMPKSLVESLSVQRAKGLVVEGTGLGHVSTTVTKALAAFIKKGGIACMASQCIDGRVDLNVYETGRDLLEVGVLPLEDMLAETALAKLMWVLGNERDRERAKAMLRENLSGEITTRTFPE